MEIQFNVSKFAGSAPDSLATLFDVLGRETLDPRFEEYGNFVLRADPWPQVKVWGNFYTVSHAFSVTGDPKEPEMIRLVEAIRANQQTANYQAAKRETQHGEVAR